MYFPYFRGRMYELLALKELVADGKLSNSIIPIIEPIKLTSTFNNLLTTFDAADHKLAIVYNPEVGDLSDSSDGIELMDNNCVIPSILVNKSAISTVAALKSQGIQEKDILAVLNKRDFIETYQTLFDTDSPKYTIASKDRQILRKAKSPKVLFDDKFSKREKNADYLKEDDEFFSEDHLYYSEEGFEGFGDYSIIGNEYNEGGFAPRAVAIHIVYFAKNNELRIHHFVSDSNFDISDVAGKFNEAVLKLQKWYSSQSEIQLTYALQLLLNHAEEGTYPGLPTIKKLSMMHHMELIGKYLGGSKKG
ncbi:sce7725 family protein [Xylocopilactobacillus apis]|uniref:Sce7725 family protein n=1 Tax=Xylocopilactobacillus apis TaxID=2932183 RepID=A0AAU9CSY5_9LACO|nr:sce7725 family protein [Xylocopilactobacillus apis]BDR55476.1 hypothetical protein KIMC2_00380 [Xylocopilactobacillus apis]